jgi:hypothetical protein
LLLTLGVIYITTLAISVDLLVGISGDFLRGLTLVRGSDRDLVSLWQPDSTDSVVITRSLMALLASHE